MTKHTPHTIITSHSHADFDAITSMVAAQKLYPGATLVGPTMVVKTNSHPYLKNLYSNFNIIPPKECDLSQVTTLVVTDTRRKGRIEHVAEVLDNPDLTVHLYDHHPDSSDDIPATTQTVKMWGSTTSIIISLLQERDIPLSSHEATLFALGIYEDTGAFTFSSTTEHDFLAASYIARFDIDFELVTELVKNDLTINEVHYLNTLLGSQRTHIINNVPVTIAEIIIDDGYIDDFSSIVTRMMELEKEIRVLFVLASMENKVHLIARSATDEVDVGKVCQLLGGGGHASAAAANFKDTTIAHAKSQLIAILSTAVKSQATVAIYMTSPAITLNSDMPIEEAEKIMNRFGLKAAPIINPENQKCIGILDLHTASRAIAHKLGKEEAKEYMQRSFQTLTPESELAVAVDIILAQNQRLIPIIENEAVCGVLTRTDILRIMVNESLRIPEKEHNEKQNFRNVLPILQSNLPMDSLELLRDAGIIGDDCQCHVYTVGGFVRDLLLNEHNLDIDLCVEGNTQYFVETFAEHLKGRARYHDRFKTATIYYTNSEGEECHIDITSARMEYYDSPGALPSVEISSIYMDLYRRDFTINAMAIHLNQDSFGQLIDPFGGQRDIKQKIISILHSLSIVEDPTRIIRAARFEQRYGFKINPPTERLIKNSLKLEFFGRLSGTRLFNEIEHIFNERNSEACIERLEGWGIWDIIHPKLALTPTKIQLLQSLEDTLSWYRLSYKSPQPTVWVSYMLILCNNLKHDEISFVLKRLNIADRVVRNFLRIRKIVNHADMCLAQRHKQGEAGARSLYCCLVHVELEGLLYLMARYQEEEETSKEISFYISKLRDVSVDITGSDLISLGYPQSRHIGVILHLILLAKIEGLAPDKESQLLLAKHYLEIHSKAEVWEDAPDYENFMRCLPLELQHHEVSSVIGEKQGAKEAKRTKEGGN